jgi:hypothetical protein
LDLAQGTRGHAEFRQLKRRLEHIRVRRPEAAVAGVVGGQRTPIVVVAAEPADRQLVIDRYQRIAALQ